ncbi:iron-containing alcohol dehydrogenase family protein [Chroococcus sp. FPU101]|uniref:iron-containing alcohol dehydrogenase family protein n=1 Tax=Chroococcus sp. FPU101 TaxID=1974212 RepID=UPI001A8EFD73|nr:iron-containing alcohol dehydrogenase family protein [Chroococcus sp. FPU101]GFE68616.1 iron-containing alcohol dehydrogenase [Chroococcus sp. FPU101]
MTRKIAQASTQQATTIVPLLMSPAQVIKGEGILKNAGNKIAHLGTRPLIIGGEQTLNVVKPDLEAIFEQYQLTARFGNYHPDCSESSLTTLKNIVAEHQADLIIGVGGGKALDLSKLIAKKCNLPVVTIPTSAATCAAWTALSNIYTNEGAFQYDVSLNKCPDLLILDYELLKTSPQRMLVAGIGDAIAKWYEASVSSGHSTATLTIAAVQQARVLRDILFQKSATALQNLGGEDWKEVVDATVLLAGVIGGLGGANCRTVAAHAVHNGLTHILKAHDALHGEKVAYGILVQLRLEELIQGNQLAVTSRQQLLKFYDEIGLPKTLEDLGLKDVTLAELRHAAEITCLPHSDIHRLPFAVTPEQLLAAMVSTTVLVKVKAEV